MHHWRCLAHRGREMFILCRRCSARDKIWKGRLNASLNNDKFHVLELLAQLFGWDSSEDASDSPTHFHYGTEKFNSQPSTRRLNAKLFWSWTIMEMLNLNHHYPQIDFCFYLLWSITKASVSSKLWFRSHYYDRKKKRRAEKCISSPRSRPSVWWFFTTRITPARSVISLRSCFVYRERLGEMPRLEMVN